MFQLGARVPVLKSGEFRSMKRRVGKYRMTQGDVYSFLSSKGCELCGTILVSLNQKRADHCHHAELRRKNEVKTEYIDVIVDGKLKKLKCYSEGLRVYQGCLCNTCNWKLEGLSGSIVSKRFPEKPRHKTLLTPQSKVMASLARKMKKSNVNTHKCRKYLRRRTDHKKSFIARLLNF